MIVPIAVAIYNVDLQRLEYIAYSVAEASRIINSNSNITLDEKVRYAMKHKKRIEKNDLGYVVAVRAATTKQLAQLGNKNSIKIHK